MARKPISTQAADDGQKAKRHDGSVIPVAGDRPRGGQEVIERWGIETKSRVTISPVRIRQPPWVPIARAQFVVKRKREVEMVGEIGTFRYAAQNQRRG